MSFLFSFQNFEEIEGITKYRTNHPGVFCKKGILKKFAKFTRKHLCQSLFFNKAARDSSTSVFLLILRNFKEQLFLQNTSGG